MENEKEQIKKLVKNFDNWVKDEEGELLYDLAKKCSGRGIIVEIGSWKGKSTIWLAKGSKAGKKIRVFAIDPHTGAPEHKRRLGEVWTFDEFKENIKKAQVDDIIEPLLMTSEEAVAKIDEAIELIFIDGAHEYKMVKKDFELWFPKMIEGGIMAFHDTNGRYGPSRLVKEKVYKSRFFSEIRFKKSITYATKHKKNSPIVYFGHVVAYYLKLFFYIIPQLIKYNIKHPRTLLKKIIRII